MGVLGLIFATDEISHSDLRDFFLFFVAGCLDDRFVFFIIGQKERYGFALPFSDWHHKRSVDDSLIFFARCLRILFLGRECYGQAGLHNRSWR